MKKWEEYKASATKQLFNVEKLEQVEEKQKFRAYKDGACQVFDDREQAKAVSKMVEPFVENQAEVNAYREKVKQVEDKADELWAADLRAEHSSLPDAVYEACLEEAFGRGTARDKVAIQMPSVVVFANKVLAAAQG